jgi:hypothetical protein|tara:strand:- start:264 stop:458 length:195 start_codon:yes stop_codon:yes gene_type:complete
MAKSFLPFGNVKQSDAAAFSAFGFAKGETRGKVRTRTGLSARQERRLIKRTVDRMVKKFKKLED